MSTKERKLRLIMENLMDNLAMTNNERVKEETINIIIDLKEFTFSI